MSDNAIETLNIVEDGDLILVVGKDNILKIRVRSLLLRITSKPFNAMFGPNFSEGQGLGNGSPVKEVPLPDDDLLSMKLICQVIHWKNDELPLVLGFDQLDTLAALIDKYSLQNAMRLAMEKWLAPHNMSFFEAPTWIEPWNRPLKIALELGYKEAFAHITQFMVMHATESFLKVIPWATTTKEGLRMIYELESSRTEYEPNLHSCSVTMQQVR